MPGELAGVPMNEAVQEPPGKLTAVGAIGFGQLLLKALPGLRHVVCIEGLLSQPHVSSVQKVSRASFARLERGRQVAQSYVVHADAARERSQRDGAKKDQRSDRRPTPRGFDASRQRRKRTRQGRPTLQVTAQVVGQCGS